jgi:RND family efflux transporter MFP subunit
LNYRIEGRGRLVSDAPILVSMLVIALGMASCNGKKDGQKAPAKQLASQTVGVVPVTIQPLPRVINASGTISAWEEVPVGAETGGLTALQVNVDEGTHVRQGQVLVKLNDSVLAAQLRQQDASVASARATLAEASANLRRSRELSRSGYLSPSSLDTAIAREQTAQAQVAAATAARGETAARLAQTSVRAPVSGVITSRSVTKGQIVGAGTELFRLVRDGRLELDAQIPETELALVKPGMPASVSSEEVGTASGHVRIVTPQVDPQSRLGLARITLTQPAGFKTGMFARAQIQAGAQPSAVVPTAAILYRENRPGVFVVDGGNHARFRPIAIAARTDTQTAITGLNVGERVVVEGAGFLGDGDQVRVAGPTAAAAPVRLTAIARAR